MPDEQKFRIILRQPTAGVDFALQKGSGSTYELVETQRSTGADLRFEFSATVKPGATAGAFTFTGPFAQGPPSKRFVYINIGVYAGQVDSPWGRRLKVPLTGITLNPRGVLEASVPGVGKDGGPNCATVNPFAGWRAVAK